VSNQNDPLAFLYDSDNDRSIFGDAWCGPSRYGNPEELVGVYKPGDESDGDVAEVYCAARPARFYTIKTKEYELSTGSGQAKLARDIAAAIAEGMLVVRER